jgi:hypothetical protein
MVDKLNQFFLPWVQPGLIASGPDANVDSLSSDQRASVSLSVVLTVNSIPLDKNLSVIGPGDVIGIDSRQVIRTEPPHGATEFEPNYFPAIEFDRPDFPWLFTPAKASNQGILRPWLCLIVVRKQPGIKLRRGDPLPVLEIGQPAKPSNELPDLSESHFWAHAQITGASINELESALASSPERTLSRLLCPRRLDPLTDYLACVAPAFEVGRKAGLNDSSNEDKLKPAWDRDDLIAKENSGSIPTVTLPVFYSWEFRTGAGGDFEQLVRKITPTLELPSGVGKKLMDISRPGFDVQPALAGTVLLGLEGALRPVDAQPDPWSGTHQESFQKSLARILNMPWEISRSQNVNQVPILAPPIYGSWYAATHKVDGPTPIAPPSPAWLNELNLDPRNRVVAAVGTQVIQDQQEQLMASAWQQLGQIRKSNQRLRQAQVSVSVNEKYIAKIFDRLSPEKFLQIVAPAQSRLQITVAAPPHSASPTQTEMLAQTLKSSLVPQTVVSGSLRRIARERGPINRRFARQGRSAVVAMASMFNAANSAAATFNLPQAVRGKATIAGVSAGLSDQLRPLFQLTSISAQAIGALPTANANNLLAQAAISHQRHLENVFSTAEAPDLRQPLDTGAIKSAALASLAPAKTVADAVLASSTFESRSTVTADPLDPMMDQPIFRRPMYEALRDLSQDYLLPGLHLVPPDSVQLLTTNAKFIESFMIGLNVEMGRELLWRNYPTDQRGTYFEHFWDSVGAGSSEDIVPIHQWGNRALGTTAIKGLDQLVLLIRGELLKRYPGAVIYGVRAITRDGKRELATDHAEGFTAGEGLEEYPIFRGSLKPDVTFIGFNLTKADVITGDGWFFVLQSQPTEPRFGLDVRRFRPDGTMDLPELKTWNDLSWGHLASSATHLITRDFQLSETQPTKGKWRHNSAHMAHITKQLPVRVAIHATELIPVTTTPPDGPN